MTSTVFRWFIHASTSSDLLPPWSIPPATFPDRPSTTTTEHSSSRSWWFIGRPVQFRVTYCPSFSFFCLSPLTLGCVFCVSSFSPLYSCVFARQGESWLTNYWSEGSRQKKREWSEECVTRWLFIQDYIWDWFENEEFKKQSLCSFIRVKNERSTFPLSHSFSLPFLISLRISRSV